MYVLVLVLDVKPWLFEDGGVTGEETSRVGGHSLF
jgi:hypothetical protein